MNSYEARGLVIREQEAELTDLRQANADLAAENTTLKSLCQLSEGLPEQLADLARERDAALRRVAQMSDHPPVCPVSGQRYFMTIEHPTRGMVATYGGPLDSYTIPEANEEGELFRERYDHDRGCWYDTECLDVWLVAGSDLAEKDERNTKLNARLQEAERCLREARAVLWRRVRDQYDESQADGAVAFIDATLAALREGAGGGEEADETTIGSVCESIETNLWLADGYEKQHAVGMARACVVAAYSEFLRFDDELRAAGAIDLIRRVEEYRRRYYDTARAEEGGEKGA